MLKYLQINNIDQIKLTEFLQQIKHELALTIDNLELNYIYEFCLEELIANSFTHLSKLGEISIKLEINYLKNVIYYYELGVPDLNFQVLLFLGQQKLQEPNINQEGGMGLALINQLAKEFIYEYDASLQTRKFTIAI